MENVTKKGFKMFDKMEILPLDHFLLTMTNLAHFHGRWLAFRQVLIKKLSRWKMKCGKFLFLFEFVTKKSRFKDANSNHCSISNQKRE